MIGITSARDHIHWRLLSTELKTTLGLTVENLIGRIRILGVFSPLEKGLSVSGGRPLLEASARESISVYSGLIVVETEIQKNISANFHLISCVARSRALRFSLFPRIALASLLAVTGCGDAPRVSPPTDSEWHEFEGTWTAAGNRYTMGLGSERKASIANLDGSLLLAGASRPAIGFRAEAIVLNDSATGVVGRAVWTDEHGDQAYSELRGEGTATHNKIVGTFIGGTGRYSGAAGTYEFSWRFVLETEDGSVQVQTVGLKGRVRAGSSQQTSGGGGPRP